MKVFVAGASGALGAGLVPELVAAGHDVVAMTRTASKQDGLRELGVRPVVADALDPHAVVRVVGEAEPEVIVHQLTALSGTPKARDLRHPERFFATTNRLRTEATDHLVAAGRAVGARRFVAQSYAGWQYARTGGPVLTEADPPDPDPPAPLRAGQEAILHLEHAVTSIEWGEGLALRYGSFYGPGTSTSSAPDAVMSTPIRKRGGGDRRRRRARPAGCVQHRRRRTRAGSGMAPGIGERARCEATEAHTAMAGAAGGR